MSVDRLDDLKRRYGAPELLDLADAEGLRGRGSGHNRCECPGCRNGDLRGASIGESDGVGVWNCHRDEHHRGTAIDFLMFARSLSLIDAADALAQMANSPAVTSPRARAQSLRAPPPREEVEEVWAACWALGRDGALAEAWAARGIDIAHVEDRGLARALPVGVCLPRWAWGAGRSWSAGPYRLVVPLYDSNGRLASLHARAAAAPAGAPKGLSPCGYALGGLVMADPLARLLLAGAACGDGEPSAAVVRRTDLLVTEGVPDFLTWATRWGDAAEQAPAVVGVVAGSWTEAVALRVADGTHVVIREHADAAGGKYTAQIAATLRGRCRVSVTVVEGAEL